MPAPEIGAPPVLLIGADGMLGRAFTELLRHPATANVPLVVETPSEGGAGHAADIATLTRLARSARRAAAREVSHPA